MHPVMPLRLSIFEDSRDYRDSLCQLFGYMPNDVMVVGAYPDCSCLPNAVIETAPDVILMDIDMPGMNGIEATAIVKSVRPATQVIILTVSEEEERIFKALQNGATGYLLKKTSPEEIVDSVHSVYAGGSPMSPAIARKVLQFFRKPTETQTTSPQEPDKNQTPISNTPPTVFATDLSPREKEILEGLVDGLSYKMIAGRYFISPDTVKNHIQGIYKKLQVHSKGEAITMAIRQNIV